jgi:chromosomal replication initiator protein
VDELARDRGENVSREMNGKGELLAPSIIRVIQDAACSHFGLTHAQLVSRTRTARLVWARQVAMYLTKELTNRTLPTIGDAFSRDNTTVMHACRRAAARISASREDYADIEALRALLATRRPSR